MRAIAAGALMLIASAQASHGARCTPLDADVVSLGEPAARFYAERSIRMKMDNERRLIEGSGGVVGRVVEPELDCKFFPNIVNMDEWRCTATAKVCAWEEGDPPVAASKPGNAKPKPKAQTKPAAAKPKAEAKPAAAKAEAKPAAPKASDAPPPAKPPAARQ